ncbi:transporter substrate-binding domain-containing protein [Brevibacillus centrosporus]|jgi:polar amino acid transport system substrate-binding protein|uniref:Polar amino acid transport system substrate-binding protein n=1 Tax=Brevibacillus centrosporus TaxID=54910 RepID=A0A1I3YGX0_9BACL|nr:transporter substrate-binding domain-containing protein [Brevibacillus centrosporus]MEC2127574.1 transporter substrate-binding domain-containing protein [Brevibacillus centrosporus]MED4910554.1 transporter substrate-binding domain-containing protein [Brevibacillus centrosporus]RNB68106.1 glutamine ABC transporter substrate-binding protein [Brevibacillus centrosporus]SFK31062.1 polar amino acid transport system substrate-binding protein [Brevibacillus centrosporus]GED30223.1 amino acid ABC t
MKGFRKGLFSLCALLISGALIAGCGSKPAEQPAASGNGGTAAAAPTDEVLQKIKDTKTLLVGTDATFQPFEYKNAQNEYEGFDIELVKAVAAELGAEKVEFVDTDFKGLIPGLQGKKFDMIVSAMYITDERKQTIDFSQPYYPGGLTIMVKNENDTIKGAEDLKGKKVAVQIGTKSAKFLKEKYPEVKLVEVEKNVEMFLELESNRVDAVVTGMPAAKVYAKQSQKVKVLDVELTQEYYGYGVRKENKEFVVALDKALKTLKENGKQDEIVKKWFGE